MENKINDTNRQEDEEFHKNLQDLYESLFDDINITNTSVNNCFSKIIPTITSTGTKLFQNKLLESVELQDALKRENDRFHKLEKLEPEKKKFIEMLAYENVQCDTTLLRFLKRGIYAMTEQETVLKNLLSDPIYDSKISIIDDIITDSLNEGLMIEQEECIKLRRIFEEIQKMKLLPFLQENFFAPK